MIFWSKLIFLSNWYFRQIDIFVKIDIFIKIDIFVKIDNFVKIVFLTISSTVFDDFINYWQLYQLLIFSSTIWSKYQMSVPVNCNFAESGHPSAWSLTSCTWNNHQICEILKLCICDFRHITMENVRKSTLFCLDCFNRPQNGIADTALWQLTWRFMFSQQRQKQI